MWKKFAINLLRYRALYALSILFLILFSVAIININGIHFTKSNAQLLPSSDSAMVHLEDFYKTFGKEENLIVIGINHEKLFENNNFSAWQQLTQKIEKIKGVKNVVSLDESIELKKDTIHQKFIPEKIAKNIKSAEDFKKAYQKIQTLPFYDGLLYNKKTGAIQSGIYLESQIIDSKLRENVVLEIKKLTDDFQQKTSIKTHLSGMPVIRTMNALEIKSESAKFIILALIATVFVFFLLYRSIKATLITLFIVLLSVLLSFATLALFNYQVTVLTALVPPLLMIISVQNIIFLVNEYLLEYDIFKQKPRALVSMISKIGNPLLLINLTTAFGFFSFVFTESKTLTEFGWLSTITVMVVSFLALIILPIFLSYIKPLKTSHFDQKIEDYLAKHIIEKFVYWVQYKRKIIFWSCGILAVISIVGMFFITRTGNMLDDMSKKADFYKDISFFDDNFDGILPLEIVIEGNPNSATQLKTLEKVDKLQEFIDSLHHSSKPISVVNLSKFARQAFYNGDAAFYSVPTKNEYAFIATYVKNSKGNNQMLKNYVDKSKSKIRITTLLKNADSKTMEQTINQIQHKLNQLFPKEHYKVYLTGIAYVFMQGTKYLTNDLLLSIVLAVIIIIVFMILMFRSKRMILVALIPNMLPLLATAGAMGIFHIPLKPSTILVFNIAFGIVVDNSIHFLSRYRLELQKHNANIHDSVLISLRETGKSIFFTSLILFLGFSVFMFSSFEGIVALGGLIALSLLISMITNIILLPALLMSRYVPTDEEFIHPDIDVFEEEPVAEEEVKDIKLEDEL